MNIKYPTPELEHRAYVEYWAENAKRFNDQGAYRWMAEQLAHLEPKKVLDIGCGTGFGIAALRAAFGCRVLSIEHNEACIDVAFENLRRLKGRITRRKRFKYRMQATGKHLIGIDQSVIGVTADPVTLIQGDLLLLDQDEPLCAFIDVSAPYDAITVWLIGAYMLRSSCATLDSLQMTEPADYRLEVQGKAYGIASALLRPGGVLHIVDRAVDDVSVASEVLQEHSERAEGSGLAVESVATRVYREGGRKGVRMVSKADAAGDHEQLVGTAQLVSIIARKLPK